MITLRKLIEKKRNREKITMLTAYDYPMGRLVEQVGMDMILVGDSGGMVSLGYKDTLPVTMEEMLTMVRAVRRGAPDTFIIADMPFLSYQVSKENAILNAGRMLKEGGADAVKMEGGVRMAETVRAVVNAGIAVQGHIGLTPQNIAQLSGYRSQGQDADSARALFDDAVALEQAGIFSVILEAVPAMVAIYLSEKMKAPTIGTGSGAGCDGQNLITPDMLGYFDRFQPKYVKRYASINEIILKAMQEYKSDVTAGTFPAEQHTYPTRAPEILQKVISDYEWVS